MRIKIRLKGVQDIDLLALKVNPSFYFERALKVALVNHVRKEPIEIGSPLPSSIPIPKVSDVYITLNDEKESDVIAWYKGIKDGCKSTAIKAIFRCSLSRAYVDVLSDVKLEEKALPVKKQQDTETPVKKEEVKPAAPKKEKVVEPKQEESDGFSIDDFVEVY